MIILGIDPGTAATGYSLIKRNFKETEILNFGCIKTDKSLSKDKRLKIIFNETSSLIKRYQPEILAIETLFFNKNIRTALSVGEAKGVVLLAASLAN
ncbi:MAG: crossover junction endodeoxyribonuclease RuvC, partial [Armatimonadetes bacterium]|nr:crossover junction endodeoxyribonuclease RuvC [Armatimonadota bacterium]